MFSLATILQWSDDDDEQAATTAYDTIQEWHKVDDVFTEEFLDTLIVVSDHLPENVRAQATSLATKVSAKSVVWMHRSQFEPNFPPGPYAVDHGHLCDVYRIYDETNNAFMLGTIPSTMHR